MYFVHTLSPPLGRSLCAGRRSGQGYGGFNGNELDHNELLIILQRCDVQLNVVNKCRCFFFVIDYALEQQEMVMIEE